MSWRATVIADSINEATYMRRRLVTMELVYPRFIHSELMTHRVFSRNAMSSRAVPTAKLIDQVRNNPAEPVHWGKNQAGMQAREELTGDDRANVTRCWHNAAAEAADAAERMLGRGAHKQIVNRLLEPFQWMRTIVSATEWDNFFELRLHPDAQPEMQFLANLMNKAMSESEPHKLMLGGWHLPYVRAEERLLYDTMDLIKISVARCARVSYRSHDGTPTDPVKDMDLHDKLIVAVPMHASPAEHQALATSSPYGRRNFTGGWKQYRVIAEDTLRVNQPIEQGVYEEERDLQAPRSDG